MDLCYQCLSLRLVHRETQLDGKLKVLESEWIVICYHWYSWNIDNITFGAVSRNFHLNDVLFQRLYLQSFSVAQFWCIQIQIKVIGAPIFKLSLCGESV